MDLNGALDSECQRVHSREAVFQSKLHFELKVSEWGACNRLCAVYIYSSFSMYCMPFLFIHLSKTSSAKPYHLEETWNFASHRFELCSRVRTNGANKYHYAAKHVLSADFIVISSQAPCLLNVIPFTVTFPDRLQFRRSIQRCANKEKCTAKKRSDTNIFRGWSSSAFVSAWGLCNIPTSNTVTLSFLDLSPPSQQVNCPQTMSLSPASGSTEWEHQTDRQTGLVFRRSR